jgi:hypothetical protein
MSEENIPVLEAPAVVVPPAPVELPEQRYEYQPTDEQGRPLGGMQVIKYKTPDELAEKLRDQNIELVRKLRSVTRKQRLGIVEESTIPDDAERFARPIEFKQQDLTLEERYKISQDLNDPQKFDAARDRLLESALGQTPETLRKTLTDQQIVTMQLLARSNASTFMETHPEFLGCTENLEVMTSWMLKNRLSPSVKNFELAHSTLDEAGLLLKAPIVREEAPVVIPTENTAVNSQPPAAPVTRISDEEQPQITRQPRVPSGLNNATSSSTGNISEIGAITLAEIDRMSSDNFRKALRDPKFAALYEKLEAERKSKRQS